MEDCLYCPQLERCHDNESTLHIPDKIKCITTVPFGDGRDVPDGVQCFAVGKMGELDRLILCGGNCAIWGFDETGKDVFWTIDIRSIAENGEIACREASLTGQTIVAGFTSTMNNDVAELAVITADGRVYGFTNTKPKEIVDKTQETLHLFGQKKHNLLVELSNFKQEEHLTEAEKVKEFRIPIGTTVECKLFVLHQFSKTRKKENLYITVSKNDRTLYLVLEASHEVCIRGVIAFAEGIFEGESYIWIPKLIEGNGDRVQIPIVTEKDMANEIHIRTFLGPQESNKLSVFETALSIPRFARFCVLQSDETFLMPSSYVEVVIKIRNQRILDWVMDTFLIDIDFPMDPEEDKMEIRFLGLASKRDQSLCITHYQTDGKVELHGMLEAKFEVLYKTTNTNQLEISAGQTYSILNKPD
ncbi:hypothetical protein TELCIR_13922 [Teladorsagia circumcincta]|uniref:Uncharacterized protein n=1 Tax=Teladorsagia circumcincta TaxID=45464 RepID=A0A2G9U4L7_TELCI|nr:hypothetical protein TELCIR_13922 [Teladorsagia circumcincta]